MRLGGARVLITGASGGIGRSIATGLAGRGAHVVLSGRDEARLVALAEQTGGEVVVADLADGTGLLHQEAEKADVLVLAAAVDGGSTVEDDTPEHVDAVLDVNLRSPMQLATRFAQAHIDDVRPGQIVLIGSVAGLAPTPLFRLYNATKFGLRGFGLALRQDLAPHGIGVTVITPGYIRDAGMLVDSGIELPKYVRTRAPEHVADAVARAVTKDPAEIFVSSLELRMAALGATVAPALAAWAHERVGIDKEAALDDHDGAEVGS